VRRLPSLLVNLAIALLALGAIGWSVALILGTGKTTAPVAPGSRTVTVGQGPVTATATADGTLEPATTATAAFDTSGTVTAVYVKVGQKVTAGQLLAKVDPADAQRSLDLAEANLDAATGALDRAAAGGSDTSAAQNAVDAARLAVDDARAAVDGTRLAAPMAGTVIAVNGTIGSSAAGSSSSASSSSSSGGAGGSGTSSRDSGFVEIANLGDLQVTAGFGEADATRIEAGQDATITWSALTGAEATGKVLAVDPSATTSDNVVTYGVTTSIGTLPEGARPGQTVSVTVTTGTASNATYVNSAAVTLTGSRYTVTVAGADGTTQTRTVKVGLRGDDAYQITEGLTPGEKVVLPESTTSRTSDARRQRGGPAGGDLGGPGGNGGPP
jgi:membrane fusion protein, macrolide-specific efflux system